jgi:hypothetical protein
MRTVMGLAVRYVGRVIRLAPDIVESIMEGRFLN